MFLRNKGIPHNARFFKNIIIPKNEIRTQPITCRTFIPANSNTIIVAQTEFNPPAGVTVTNWFDARVAHKDRDRARNGRPSCRNAANITEIIVHETVTRTINSNNAGRPNVQFVLHRDGMNIPLDWRGRRGFFFLFGRDDNLFRARIPGIYAHGYFHHSDGYLLVLYAWLRIDQNFSPEDARAIAFNIAANSIVRRREQPNARRTPHADLTAILNPP